MELNARKENVKKALVERKKQKLVHLNVLDSKFEGIGNYNEIIAKAEEIEENCSDIVKKCGELSVCKDAYSNALMLGVDNENAYYLTDWSINQLCERIGVPSGYMKKCIQYGKLDLVLSNMNRWIKDYPKKELKLRLYKENVRGIVGIRYAELDGIKVINKINEVIGRTHEYQVQSSYIDEEIMNIRIIRNEMLNVEGEDLHIGFQVRNSDVGRSTLVVQVLVYKVICSNGLLLGGGMGELFMRRHVVIKGRNFEEEFEQAVASLPKVIEYVEKEIVKNKIHRISDLEMQKLIDEFKESMNASDELVEGVKEAISHYDSNRWGFINAITEVAQNYSLDRQIELETYAGELLIS